jgi:hypothetical protein
MTGHITVANGRIVVVKQVENGHGSAEYDRATVETLADAARVLAAWMDLPHEDQSRECQRIHANDELRASIRDAINRRWPE